MALSVDRIQGLSGGLAVKAPVRAVSSGNVTLAGLQTVGGVALAAGDRVLLVAQTNPVENGIYSAASGPWARTKDCNGRNDLVKGTLIPVAGVAETTLYRVTSADPVNIGTDELAISALLLTDAALIGNTPAGSIAATTVQGAINELDTEAAKSATLAAAGGAGLIGFIQAGTGAVATTTQVRLRESISAQDFGAVGDGVADDTTALQNCINASVGRVIDLLGLTYRATASLNLPSNTILCNGTLDGSGMADGDTLLEALGVLGASTGITNTITNGASSFLVDSAAGIAADSILYLQSATIFGSGATTNGEFSKVKTLVASTVTPYRRVSDDYGTSRVFFKPALVRNITLRNLRLLGGGDGLNHSGAHFYLCENVVVEGCWSSKFAQRHFQYQRCLNVRVSNTHTEHSQQSTGLAYGHVVANGCNRVTITGCTGIDLRHGVSIGAENGVDRNIAVTGCSFDACTDSALDCHPQSQHVTIAGNTCSHASVETTQDGLVVQGTDVVVTGNTVVGWSRVGILLQPLCVNSNFGDSTVCSGNNVSGSVAQATPAYGISYDNQRTGGNARVSICGNVVNVPTAQGYGILVEIQSTGSTVNGLSVCGNTVFARRDALRVLTATLKLLRCGAVSGNAFESLETTGYDCVTFSAASANYIERCMISGNTIFGGRYGINSTNGQRMVANTNMIQAFGTAAANGLTATADNYTT